MVRETKSLNTQNSEADVIRIGIMHSLTGDPIASEELVKEIVLMAIAEINQSGGVLGKMIEPVVVDIGSHAANITVQAKNLLSDLEIRYLFGCGRSATRKSMIPLLERYQAQLWYPYSYEGIELSKNIFYTGACPNQVVQPAIDWLLQREGDRFGKHDPENKTKRIYLIGTHDIYSHTVNKIIRAQLKQQNAQLVGESCTTNDSANYQDAIAHIKDMTPDAVISTLSPEQSIAFIQQYALAGIRAQDIPVLSMRLSELELQQIVQNVVQNVDISLLSGHLASANYFQSLDTATNQDFLRKATAWFRASAHEQLPIVNALMQSAYMQMFLWKMAIETAETFDPLIVRESIYTQQNHQQNNQSFLSPAGLVFLEPNHHIWTACRIASVNLTGKLEILYTLDPIKPSPWLGAEELNSSAANVLIEMLTESKHELQQSLSIEKDAQELESTIIQLGKRLKGRGRNQLAPELIRAVMSKMFQANQRLIKAQSDLLAVEGALREANESLEQRIEQRTIQLQKTIKRLQNEAAERQQTEMLLRESQQRFSAIADNVPGVVYRAVLHPNGDVSMPYISPRTQEIFGVSVEDFSEHFEWVFDMAHPEDRAKLNEIVRQSAESISFFEHEYRVSSLFQKVKWVRIISQPQRQNNGDTVWDGVIIDITHQKQIEESLKAEQEKSENLLLNILPKAIVHQLKIGNNTIASRSENVTILFADIVDFTDLSTKVSPNQLVSMLNEIFSCFDMLADQFGLEKIKTIGDAYMVVGGLPTPRDDHAEAIAEMALAMQKAITAFKRDDGKSFRLRIGINTGPVVAGVIGIRKFIYDLWGDAVNIASRMESHGIAGGIQVTTATYELLKEQYSFWHRGKIYIKGRGELDTYMLLENLKNKAQLEASQSVELSESLEVSEHDFVLIP
jgi:PAS domain S-box-containing protein